jgi:hypothetical protein
MNVIEKNGGDEAMACFLHMLNSLAESCHCSVAECGDVSLGYGCHEITVKTACGPKDICLSTNNDTCDTPVCQGDVNMVGYSLLPDGFVLYADIKSNTCVVSWSVKC